MEAPEFVFVALVLGVPIALAIWLIVRAVAARNRQTRCPGRSRREHLSPRRCSSQS